MNKHEKLKFLLVMMISLVIGELILFITGSIYLGAFISTSIVIIYIYVSDKKAN